jgi:NADH-quinone oxidoreductase subunit J
MTAFPESQMIVGAIFLLCIATTVVGALIAALTARIIRSVCAVMLAEPEEGVRDEKRGATLLWGGFALLVSAAIFWGLWHLGARQDWTAPVTRVNDFSISAIGKSLLTTYSMAFELISLALLVAIIGALAIARTGRTKP